MNPTKKVKTFARQEYNMLTRSWISLDSGDYVEIATGKE